MSTPATTGDPQVGTARVRIIGLPVALYAAARERQEGLLRELALVGVGDGDREPDALRTRLIAAGESLRARYGTFTSAAQARLDAAVEAGEPTVDLEYEVPRSAAAAGDEYLRLLGEADEYCRHGDLLTLAPDDEVVAFRRWFLGEFGRQLRGAEPTPWRG